MKKHDNKLLYNLILIISMLAIASVNFLFAGQSPFLEICRKEIPIVMMIAFPIFLTNPVAQLNDLVVFSSIVSFISPTIKDRGG